MYSVRGKEMFNYLSWYYGQSRIMQAILDSQGIEIDAARSAIEESLKQFYTDTVDWGMDLWEEELAILPPFGATDDLRIALIKAKLLRPPTMTPVQIAKIVNCFVPSKDATVQAIPQSYVFTITFPSVLPYQSQQEIFNNVEESKPAHLAVKYVLERSYSNHLYIGSVLRTGKTIKIYPVNQYSLNRVNGRSGYGFVIKSAKHIIIKAVT